jgi:hypothetical protein
MRCAGQGRNWRGPVSGGRDPAHCTGWRTDHKVTSQFLVYRPAPGIIQRSHPLRGAGEKLARSRFGVLRPLPLYGGGGRSQNTAALGPGPRTFFYFFIFFLVGIHFFQGLDEVDFFDESLSSLSNFDESLSSLSRLG